MSELPKGWELVRLKDFVNVEWGNTSITKKSYVKSGYPAFSATGQDGFLPQYEWSGAAVILSAIGAKCGKCFATAGKWTAIKNTIVIQGNEDQVDHRLLWYYLNDAKRWEISGSGQPFITMGTANEVEFPFPPLPEQHRIVEKLDKLLAKVEASRNRLENIPRILKRFRQSVLAAACSGKLTEDWREEHERVRSLAEDKNGFPDVPESWRWEPLGQLFSVATGTTPPKKDPANYSKQQTEYPFFKPTDLDAGGNVREAREWLSKRGKERARLLPAMTVCVTSIGATIGKTGLLRVPGSTNQQINSILPRDGVRSEYTFYYCCSPYFQRRILEESSSTTLPIINKSRFEELEFPFPPADEQHEIVRRVEQLFTLADHIEERYKKANAHVEKLTQSILAKAFRGKLVPQDPNDLPASQLLEEIRKKRSEEKNSQTEPDFRFTSISDF